MSGHSKWASIKHKKAITDAKKGKVFSKISALISIAAKNGGDPALNPTLRLYLEKAKQAGMQKENIDRAIKRGTGELGGQALEEVMYEIYGPGGVGIIVEGVTDNHNRSVAEIKAILNKFNGKLAASGAVSYLFEKQGVIMVKNDGQNSDNIALLAIDAGASDIEEASDTITVYTQPQQFESIKKILEEHGYTVESAEIANEPKAILPLDTETSAKIEKLLDALDDLDDVTNVSTNAQLV